MKKVLNVIWNEFVYGGHLHSLGVASLIFTGSVILNVKIGLEFLIIVYLGIHSAYLYNRYKEFDADFATNPERTGYIKKYVKKIPYIVILSFLIIISILLYNKNFTALFFSIFIFLIGLLYSELFKNFTKKILGLKNIFIPLLFSSLIILLIIYYHFQFNLSVFLIFIFIFIRVFNNTVFFDIKDIESDAKEKLLTFPVVFGKKKIFYFLNIINILSGIVLIIGVALKILPIFCLILMILIFYNFCYFKKSQSPAANFKQIAYIYADGEYLLWTILILLGKIIL
jgi:4-hydroxybenzoate polyprenyltransferase